MSIALAFWVTMLLALVIAGAKLYHDAKSWMDLPIVPYILFLLLGWAVFGAPIKG